MLTAIVLTALAVLFRMFASTFHVWNFAPLGAVSLFAGSRLPRRWAWVVPVVAMAISDYLLDHDRYRPLFELTRWTIYATFAATTLLGPLANRPRFGRWLLPVLSLSGSTLFFLTSNLATWGEGLLYPMTFSGLIVVLCQGYSILRQYLAADLLGTALALRPGTLLRTSRRWHGTARPQPRLAEITSRSPRVRSLPACLISLFQTNQSRGQAARQCSFTGRSPGRTGRRGDHYRRQGAASTARWAGRRSTSGARCGEVVPRPIPVSVALGELNDWLTVDAVEMSRTTHGPA